MASVHRQYYVVTLIYVALAVNHDTCAKRNREREKRARYIVVVVDLILTDQPTGMEWKKVCKTSKRGVVCWDIT